MVWSFNHGIQLLSIIWNQVLLTDIVSVVVIKHCDKKQPSRESKLGNSIMEEVKGGTRSGA